MTLTLNVPLPSIVFHNKMFVFIMIFKVLSFLRLTHGLIFYIFYIIFYMSVRLCDSDNLLVTNKTEQFLNFCDGKILLLEKTFFSIMVHCIICRLFASNFILFLLQQQSKFLFLQLQAAPKQPTDIFPSKIYVNEITLSYT